MKKDLLLIIDMQNVYAAGGAWCCPGAEAAAGNIHELISSSGQDLDVIFTGFIAGSNPKGTWKDYNREYADINNNDHANAMMDVFREDLKKYPLYTKSVYSSLDIPEVREAVKKADRVLVAGVVAECCVLSTVMALIDAGAYVVYLKDCVAGQSKETEAAVETVISGLEPLQT
ncbi:MAG: isochorismatase family protein, partial [Lachnospiraceae bacterium]|nr:isochorismatase family protein [Lachnospiraceae bacterium]